MGDVLIVDDDTDVAETVSTVVGSRGHQVRHAPDGREGLRIIHERPPDVIVLDVEMPQLTGPEMAYRMFVHDAGLERIPIVLVSGRIDLTAIAARVGTPYFLAKPFSVAKLMQLLDRALLERRSPIPVVSP